jgi:hypothetical protein
MSRLAARLLPLSALLLFPCAGADAQQPPARPPLLSLGDAVVTGFSGTVRLDRQPRAGRSAADATAIDPNGSSAQIFDVGRPAHVWDGSVLQAPAKLKVTAGQAGQLFGIAIDDRPAPNLYLAATSLYGLHVVRRGSGGAVERLRTGGPGAQWMDGQWGLGLQGGPGSIYVVDGNTAEVRLLANVTLDGVPNPGPALGNIAYDPTHKQLFVSDLYSGMIHRIDLNGADLGRYDHGATGRAAASLAPVPFDPANRLNIANNRFNTDNPDTWSLAPPPRRVFALAVKHETPPQPPRLYYSVWDGPQIWSVGIAPDGGFAGDSRLEVDIPRDPGPFPVTDIAFSQKGAMVVAQRSAFGTSFYDYSGFTRAGEPRVLRFWPKDRNDPPSPSHWKPVPEEYPVGFAGNFRNPDGGVDFAYGYDRNGILSTGACEYALVVTGEKLRLNPQLRERLEPGGPLPVQGLQIAPAEPVRDANTPPWLSYFVDYDGKFDDTPKAGHLGSVRTHRAPCVGATAAYGGPGYGGSPPYVGGPSGTPTAECVGRDCPPPPPPPSCFAATGRLVCDPRSGHWVYQLTVNDQSGIGINSVTAISLSGGISVTNGPTFPVNPPPIGIALAGGQSGTIEICGFNQTAAASGKPYDCCRTRLRVTIPNRLCGVRR